jgi:hypothetical protein
VIRLPWRRQGSSLLLLGPCYRFEGSATEDRLASVVLEEDVAISKGDEPDAVTERDLGAAVFLMPPWVVIVRKDEDVNQS